MPYVRRIAVKYQRISQCDWNALLRRLARRSKKQQGEWAELEFMAKAALLGFLLSRPWGDSIRASSSSGCAPL